MPDKLEVTVDQAIELAQHYLDSGQPFHAHEVFETVWKTGDPAERDLWQGLAQIAVGVTHAMRGNRGGAVTLLRRGANRIRTYSGDPHAIDIARFASWADQLADEDELPPSTHPDAAAPESDVAVPRLRKQPQT